MKYVTFQKKQDKEDTNTLTDRPRIHDNDEEEVIRKTSTTKNIWKMKKPVSPKLEVGKKLTFGSTIEAGVSQKIQNFKRLSEVTKCVIGSGFCTGHNVKLERTVKMKKMSNIGSNGKIEWTMREVTSLACPAKTPSVPVFSAKPVMSQHPEPGVTNGKRRKLIEMSNDQPQPTRTGHIVKEDIPLDEIT